MYAVILAGGVGERFWPLSRKNNPKQFLDVFTGEPLLLTTIKRLKGFIPDERILIVTAERYAAKTRRLLKGRKGVRVIGEPVGKNTAPAIAAAAAIIEKDDPGAIMAVLSADHIITPVSSFVRSLKAAGQLARQAGKLVCLGVPPSHPHTGLGYIEADGLRVKKFIEKPDLKRAGKFVRSGRHLWNCGIFVWKTSAILRAFERCMPRLFRQLSPLRGASSPAAAGKALRRFYLAVEKQSIDYGILEKWDDIAVVKSPIRWSDVGSWNVFKGLFKADGNNNLFRGNCVDLNSRGCLVVSDRGVTATCGLEDIFIIRHGDALLVIPAGKTGEIKRLLSEIRRSPFSSSL